MSCSSASPGWSLSMAISGGWQFSVRGRVAQHAQPVHADAGPDDAGVPPASPGRAARPSCRSIGRRSLRVLRLATAAGVFAAALLSPVLYAVGLRIADGRWDSRAASSGAAARAGVDLAALLPPEPEPSARARRDTRVAHAAAGCLLRKRRLAHVRRARHDASSRGGPAGGSRALVGRPRAASSARSRWAPSSTSPASNTHVPGPWALLRYVPVIGLARTPSRFSIVAMLMVAMLFGAALTWLGRQRPAPPARAPGRGAALC